MPDEEVADLHRLEPPRIKLPDEIVDLLRLRENDLGRPSFSHGRKADDHLEGVSDMIVERRQLLEVPVDLAERFPDLFLLPCLLGDIDGDSDKPPDVARPVVIGFEGQ